MIRYNRSNYKFRFSCWNKKDLFISSFNILDPVLDFKKWASVPELKIIQNSLSAFLYRFRLVLFHHVHPLRMQICFIIANQTVLIKNLELNFALDKFRRGVWLLLFFLLRFFVHEAFHLFFEVVSSLLCLARFLFLNFLKELSHLLFARLLVHQVFHVLLKQFFLTFFGLFLLLLNDQKLLFSREVVLMNKFRI